MPHNAAIPLYEDNVGAFLMADAGQLTRRTQHIDIRHFALLDWVEKDLVRLCKISTTLNSADILTKSTARIIFHRHNDVIMGNFSPHGYAKMKCCFAFATR